jgi:uncharacterized protein YfaS (alpha-2-macroglobulin family)
MYTSLVTEQYRTDRQATSLHKGISITRQYTDQHGSPDIHVGDTVTVKVTVSGLSARQQYGVIEDQLPTGLIPVNTNLKNEQTNSQSNYYQTYGVSGREFTPNGIIMSLYNVPAGQNSYTYQARAVIAGNFSVPPATTSLMYSPEINGRTGSLQMTIGDQDSSPAFTPVKRPPADIIAPRSKSDETDQVQPTIKLAVGLLALGLISGLIAFFLRRMTHS